MLITLPVALAGLGAAHVSPQAKPHKQVGNSGNVEICDLGWGPEVTVGVGEAHKDPRYQVPEGAKQRLSSSAYPSAEHASGSHGSLGAGCPTRILPLSRFPERLESSFRYSSSDFRYEQRLDVRTRQQWNVQWKRMSKNSSIKSFSPPIDFRHEMVLIAAMGTRPSGGYRVVINKVIERGADIQAVVTHVSPGPKCGAIAAITHPLDVVRIPASDKPLNWVVLEQLSDCSLR
jgi:hypothetical protein